MAPLQREFVTEGAQYYTWILQVVSHADIMAYSAVTLFEEALDDRFKETTALLIDVIR